MRFQTSFTRVVVTPTGTTLGTDAVPSTRPNATVSDNLMECGQKSIDGWPIQRIAVGYAGPAAAKHLPASLYVWDERTELWFLCTTRTLVPSQISWFDMPSLGQVGRAEQTPGCLQFALVVSAAGSDPDGTYTFTLGADLSNDSAAVASDGTTYLSAIDTSTAALNGKLPATAAGADAVANPTLTRVFGYLQAFGGTTWDRVRSGVTTLGSTFTGMLNSLPWAIYHATPGTRSDGQGGPLEADNGGRLKVAHIAGSAASAAALATVAATDDPFALANQPSSPVFPAQVTVGGAGGVVATQFSAQAAKIGVWVQALSTNTASVWIGGSDLTTSKGFELTQGSVQFFPVTNLNLLYHVSTTTGQKVNLLVV